MKTVANSPEEKVREIVDACADCDCCRYLMDEVCLMFPRLYSLADRERETGKAASPEELRVLAGLCNFCALCPCPNIRAGLMEAKTGFVAREGLGLGIRVLENVGGLSKICGAFPRLSNKLLDSGTLAGFAKRVLGMHPDRRLPRFPDEPFDAFVRKRNLDRRKSAGAGRKVAYFAGCTARHFFPEVARATVEVLLANDVHVRVPPQNCCGMPSFLEGDRRLTLSFVRENLERLSALVDEGYDIVCSCPTCGFVFKNLLKEGAYYSDEMQEFFGRDPKFIKVPSGKSSSECHGGFDLLDRTIYSKILGDDGYFSCLSPKKRALVSERTFDAGEYLAGLAASGAWEAGFRPAYASVLYYPPCHSREQGIGSPYVKLLETIPGIRLETLDSELYCCGMAGIMGFKKDFHDCSLQVGARLIKKIEERKPELVATDCLSCRLQFRQTMAREVRHPVEIVAVACDFFDIS